MKKNILLFVIFFSLFSGVRVIAATGIIDATSYVAKVCHDVTCATPVPGAINFKPTGVTPVVVDDVAGISGKIWGNELGWITLNPNGQGLTLNATTGAITGKAWSQVSGWINFNPTGQGVFINTSTGEFSGWAWTGGPYGGWIKFDCTDSSSCVKTSWRPTPVVTPPVGCTVNCSPVILDACINIPGIQTAIPNGYTINANGCVQSVVDMCPNLVGEQSVVPSGFNLDATGNCISTQVDYCPNLSGIQSYVPENYSVNIAGQCILDTVPEESNPIDEKPNKPEEPTLDVCTNLKGAQPVVPEGYSTYYGVCIVTPEDICPNIADKQTVIPEGYIVNNEGNCAIEPIDLCKNISGYQDKIPENFVENNGVCLLATPENKEILNKTIEVVAYPFIPEKYQVPIDVVPLNKIVTFLDNTVNNDIAKTRNFKVDLVTSTATAGVAVVGISWWWLLILWGRRWGVVYNAVTRQVLKQVEVRIFNTSNKLIKTTKTDKYGRYDFRVEKGEYRVEVDLPKDHSFPAKSLNFEPKHIYKDKVVYKDLYYGGTIKVPRSGRITLNIPLDPIT